MLKLFLNTFIVVYLGISLCFSQSQPVFKKINTSNGLTNGNINSIAKEKNGFVWIGTNNGLNRFDGKEIKVYNKQNSALTSDDISDILIDKNNQIWIATNGGGLYFYDASFDKFRKFIHQPNTKNSILSNNLGVLFEDSHGKIWVGTDRGLSCFDARKYFQNPKEVLFTNYPTSKSGKIICIYQDKNHQMWIGTFGNGLQIFNLKTQKYQTVSNNNNEFSNYINVIAPFSDHQILVGTSGSGLLLFDTNTLQFSNYLNDNLKISQEINIIRAVIKDQKNNLWIGTDGNGLFKIENYNKQPNSINYIHNSALKNSISGNAIFEILEDEDANIWIGTAWNGLSVIDTKNNSELLHGDISGKNPSPVLSIFKKNEYLYFGLDGDGMTEYNTKTKKTTYYNNKNKNSSFSANYVQKITETSDGLFWIGTFKNGLLQFNRTTEKFTSFKHQYNNKNSISFDDVRDIIEDEKKNLWIATWGGGLNYFDTKTQQFSAFTEGVNNPKTINNNHVIDLVKDGNLLWMATYGGGLNVLDIKKGTFNYYKHNEKNQNSISNNNLFSIYKDTKNYLWIGTSGSGINRLNLKTKQVERFDTIEHLKYQTVTGIVEDNQHNIWFSTKQGIVHYDYQTNTFKNIPKLSSEFHINSIFKDQEGYIYFGGIEGVIKLNPNKIVIENNPPKVKFTNFKLFNKDVLVEQAGVLNKNITYADKIVLKHHQDVMTFEFSAMEFPFSNTCEYAIKMENFDKEWRHIGKERSATYTNLAPGKYVFQVKSKEIGGTWDKSFTSIEVEVLKPFWLSWWAICFYLLLVILTFYLFRKYIIAWEQLKTNLQLEKINHEKDIEIYELKQQFFTNISHDIRTPITLILGAVNRIVSHNENSQNSPVETIKKNCNHLLQLLNELLDFKKLEQNNIKVTNNDLIPFAKEIFLSFYELALQKQINFTFDTKVEKSKLWFNKNEIEKVFYNLLSNAFKFSNQGGYIQMQISESETHVQIEIIDQGKGISSKNLVKIFNRFYKKNGKNADNHQGWGIGLTITKEIIEKHHGEISVESSIGKGSNFKVLLKKGNTHFGPENLEESTSMTQNIENYYTNTSKIYIHLEAENLVENENYKNKTVLIVEDNSDIRKYVAEVISEQFTVLEAVDGKDALNVINNHAIDLVISDVMMPNMDGLTLTRKIKTNLNTSHIPVILLTAKTAYIYKMQGFETGADDYIAKPFNELLLLSRIKNVLKNRELIFQKFQQKELIPISQLQLNKADEIFMKKFIQIIEDNMSSEELDAKFVCSELAMSHSVLYKKIKMLTNMTYVEFVRDYKLKTAKYLISEKKFSVADASFHVGYADRKYFSKLFKAQFGSAPSEFIKGK